MLLLLLHIILGLAPYLSNASAFWGYRSRSSFDLHKAYWPTWATEIPDMVNISSLSFAGTHKSMSYAMENISLRFQNWDLRTQLYAGIRYLDISARLQDDQLQIYHAGIPTGHSYVDILVTIIEFLDAFPTEFVMMHLREEGKPLGRNTIDFHQAFSNARFHHPLLKDRYEKHFYMLNDSMPLPTIGQVRSKIIILQEFPSPPVEYGLQWGGPRMVVQDRASFRGLAHLRKKWEIVVKSIEKVNWTPLNNKKLFLTHLSVSTGVLPMEAAAGPRNRSVLGLNDELAKFLEYQCDQPGATRVGIIILDFPGEGIVYDILRWNRWVYTLM